ncbi:toxin PezT, partial [Streptococcus pneumoniae]
DSDTDDGSAADVLQDCLFGKWSKVEEEMIKEAKEYLKRLSKSNNENILI